MADLTDCPHCSEEITEDSDFCPHCGILLTEEKAFCTLHAQDEATGICIICRQPVCRRCAAIVHRRTFCPEHKTIEVQQDWAMIFQSTEIVSAELVKSVLETAEFHVQVQNFASIGYAWDGGGDSPQSRSNLGEPAKVFVPIPEYLEAAKTMSNWNTLPEQK
jgi:RNA polymerase subunit RPABC4/transcription elongation factor Spt4